LHRRFGWQLAAISGVLATAADWDGLTIVFGMRVFDQAHRAWGHNLLVCVVLGIVLAALDYRYDLMGWARVRLERILASLPPKKKVHANTAPASSPSTEPLTEQSMVAPAVRQRTMGGYAVWLAVGLCASLSHLPEDLVVSGTEHLTDWHLQLLWPFSRQGFIYPLVPWGDAGVSVILVAGMFAMWRWSRHLPAVALTTLLLAVGYLVLRGWIG
jgi:hypothetical protein